MKKTLLGLTMLALLAGCAGNLPPVDTGQLLCLATCKDGKCEKKDGAWVCVVTTPVTCPEKCPAGQECTDPKVGCVPIVPPAPTCADLVCEYGCTENPPTCKPKPPATTCEPACKATEKCVERGAAEKVYECVPIPGTPTEAPLIRDEDLTHVGPAQPSQMWAETDAAIKRWRELHPEKWRGDGACLTSVSGIDEAFLGISTELLRVKIVAGQSITDGGQRSDCIFVNRTGTNLYEEAHLFDYGRACVATGPNAMKELYRRGDAPPVEPPPVTDTCPHAPCPDRVWTAETLPDGWGEDAIGTARWHFNVHIHTMGNYDSTAVTDRNEPYCASIGMSPMGDGTLRASCPMRPDGHVDREDVENWLLEGGPVVEGRNGQNCKANNNDNPFAFLAGTGNCRICNTPKTVCSEWQ